VAPVGRRFAAYLVDGALVTVVYLAAALPALASAGAAGSTANPSAGGALAVGLLPLALVTVVGGAQWVAEAVTGATAGGALLGIRTVAVRTGLPAGLLAILLRNLVVAAGAIACFVGQVVVVVSGAWDREPAQRGWHDKAAGTLVLRAGAARGRTSGKGASPASWDAAVERAVGRDAASPAAGRVAAGSAAGRAVATGPGVEPDGARGPVAGQGASGATADLGSGPVAAGAPWSVAAAGLSGGPVGPVPIAPVPIANVPVGNRPAAEALLAHDTPADALLAHDPAADARLVHDQAADPSLQRDPEASAPSAEADALDTPLPGGRTSGARWDAAPGSAVGDPFAALPVTGVPMAPPPVPPRLADEEPGDAPDAPPAVGTPIAVVPVAGLPVSAAPVAAPPVADVSSFAGPQADAKPAPAAAAPIAVVPVASAPNLVKPAVKPLVTEVPSAPVPVAEPFAADPPTAAVPMVKPLVTDAPASPQVARTGIAHPPPADVITQVPGVPAGGPTTAPEPTGPVSLVALPPRGAEPAPTGDATAADGTTGRTADPLGDLAHTRLRPPPPASPPAAASRPTTTGVRLVFDTGERVDVAGDGLVGRAPAPEDGVVHVVAVADPQRSVSKVHLAFGADDEPWRVWVRDRGSTNGTALVAPDGTVAALTPGARAVVEAGWTIRYGKRSIRVEAR